MAINNMKTPKHVPFLKKMWCDQHRFIITYSCVILIPLLCLIFYVCYDEGIYRKYGTVSLTIVSHYLSSTEYHGGGGRFSTYQEPHMEWKYTIMGKNESGQRCYIDSNDHRGVLNMGIFPYKEGDTLQTWYTLHKEKGDWRWTTDADFFLWVWIGALFFMFLKLLWNHWQNRLSSL